MRRQIECPPAGNNRISSIEIDELFGNLSYKLDNLSREVVVLYGDNGSGKTHILSLVYHLLAPGSHKGHRSYLKKIPFRKLVVKLEDGTIISASREHCNEGPYTMDLKPKGTKSLKAHFCEKAPDTDGKNWDWDNVQAGEDITKKLSEIVAPLHYLPESRDFLSDTLEIPKRIPVPRLLRSLELNFDEQNMLDYLNSSRGFGPAASLRQYNLDALVDSLNESIRKRILLGHTKGAEDTEKVYHSVVQKLLLDSNELSVEDLSDDLADEIDDLSKRAVEAGFKGVVPKDANKLVKLLREAPKDKKHLVGQVVKPYLESVAAQLRAQVTLVDQTAKLVSSLSKRLSKKRAEYSLVSGMKICDLDGKPLLLGKLSSGEQQLLLLFCCAMLSSGYMAADGKVKRSILVVDEPELSLNIKWQRDLIEMLLEISNHETQLIFASHAVEVFADYNDCVVAL